MNFEFRQKKINPVSIFIAVLIGLALGTIFLLFGNYSISEVYAYLIKGSLGSNYALTSTIRWTAMYLLCGAASGIAFKGGMFNMGTEGQLYMGAFASTLVGIYVKGLPAVVHIPLCLLTGMAAGMLYGAAIPALFDGYAATFYLDKTRQPLLWQMWGGKLSPFGADAPSADYGWKEYYYCDYFLLHFQKKFLIERMDYYIEAIEPDSLKIMPRKTYDEVVQTMLRYPIKEVEIYQPGPWGAYRYRDFWDIPGLECNAWNELAGPELSILIDVGASEMLNMPFVNLMQYADMLVGPYLNRTYPDLFPLDAWLDDGYFPEKTPAERISMPIHTHPSTAYVNRHFNEPIGRYETYYIAEAYEGANTWMGFFNDVDLEEWERKCRESNNLKEIQDWKDYICNWESSVGDLYLIPPGTDHGHGGNQMVLELDTCPSIAGTEYSFFSYDFARHSWDDHAKTMTGKPLKMHLDHSFNCSKFRREDYVDKKLRAKPSVIKWTKDYWIDRYSSVPEMPFEIERLHYYTHAEYDTEGKYCHIVTLTVGKQAKIFSKADPALSTTINLFQAAVIPASFGEYAVESSGDGANTIALVRWKKG